MQRAFDMQMVVQMNKKCKKTRCVMVNEISNFGQGLTLQPVFIALRESWVKAWTPP